MEEGKSMDVRLTFGEVRNLQALLEFALPSLLGWHCLYEPKIVSPNSPPE